MSLRQENDAIRTHTDRFASGGKPVAVDRYQPRADGRHPAVILLHGVDGMRSWHGDLYRQMASDIARDGYAVFVVHYFDATGAVYSPAQANPLHFLTWMQVVRDAVTHALADPAVTGAGVGLIGVSLGAYIGLSAATQDGRVRAVVDCFGGIPDFFAAGLERMPPVLILHGEADSLVPLAEARKLERLLKQSNRVYEIRTYPGQGHGFHGAESRDALERALQFLDRYVKGAEA